MFGTTMATQAEKAEQIVQHSSFGTSVEIVTLTPL